MSDAENQTPEASAAPAAGGFTPEPPPPQVDAANVKELFEDQAVADDAQGVQVPHETAKKALEAVQILVENNRAASQQLESLMGIVLDAAEVANRSASAVSTTGSTARAVTLGKEKSPPPVRKLVSVNLSSLWCSGLRMSPSRTAFASFTATASRPLP